MFAFIIVVIGSISIILATEFFFLFITDKDVGVISR